MSTPPAVVRIDRLPLWRLLVMLEDTERTIGPDSDTARQLVDEIHRRLRRLPDEWHTHREAGHEE
jgi:hypothetical protein